MRSILLRSGLVVAFVVLSAAPAHAQSAGGCDVQFNGVAADRIDSINSPLELDTQDTLIFQGTDPGGTGTARVELIIGPFAVESKTATYATPESDFLATITLDDVSPYGVGLFSARGTTDSCSASVWVRVSGRFPLATLTGLTALGLTLGGITGQLGAVASRRRWARSAAALGGIATGAGLTVLGQEFGRLQVSYPSIAGVILAAGGIGFGLSALLNPALRRQRGEARASNRPGPDQASRGRRPAAAVEARRQRVAGPEPANAPAAERASAPDPLPKPVAAAAPYWCYVMAPTDVFDITEHTATVAVLHPGSWYLAKRTVSGWVHVVASDGTEGWVAEGAVHRQG